MKVDKGNVQRTNKPRIKQIAIFSEKKLPTLGDYFPNVVRNNTVG